jgi:hypothetical protein
VAGVLIFFLPLAPQELDVLRRFSSVRPLIAKANFQTADTSVRGVRISDIITGYIFPTVSLFAAPECAHGCALTGAADVYACLLIFCKRLASRRFIDQTISRPAAVTTR